MIIKVIPAKGTLARYHQRVQSPMPSGEDHLVLYFHFSLRFEDKVIFHDNVS